jgi:hypothetical protein
MMTTTKGTVMSVEPHPTKNGWLADMRPVDGPVLGANGTSSEPFKTRAEALAAEREWLRKEKGL